jgi:hypothetical protein
MISVMKYSRLNLLDLPRFGVLTTEEVKYASMTLVSVMLREKRITIRKPLLSENPTANSRRLLEQLSVFSLQFKVNSRLISFFHLQNIDNFFSPTILNRKPRPSSPKAAPRCAAKSAV